MNSREKKIPIESLFSVDYSEYLLTSQPFGEICVNSEIIYSRRTTDQSRGKKKVLVQKAPISIQRINLSEREKKP